MASQLPTFSSANWAVAKYLDSLIESLRRDADGSLLRLYMYAVTESGWGELRRPIRDWLQAEDNRQAIIYAGTDHALTAPNALRRVIADGVAVHLLINHSGVYHPKVVWLSGPAANSLWVGSNNLTREGLLHNIEFATLTTFNRTPRALTQWSNRVGEASVPLTDELLNSYEDERNQYAAQRANTGTFTWSRRTEPAITRARRGTRRRNQRRARRSILPRTGDLIIEIMPLETGPEGKQIQLPQEAIRFFGLRRRVGATRTISLVPIGSTDVRQLTMTVFANRTSRLSISDLDYRDRPCLMLFRRRAAQEFAFEIVSRSLFPRRFQTLLAMCNRQTRQGSRRWTIV